jgi:aminoacyl tRNA synthase complex-interacting multifunctional protein 1
VLNPKKKYWETVQPDFKTNGETFAFYQDKPFLIKSSSGEDVKVKAASVTEGLIR